MTDVIGVLAGGVHNRRVPVCSTGTSFCWQDVSKRLRLRGDVINSHVSVSKTKSPLHGSSLWSRVLGMPSQEQTCVVAGHTHNVPHTLPLTGLRAGINWALGCHCLWS